MGSNDEPHATPDIHEHPLVVATNAQDSNDGSTVKLVGYLARDPEEGFWRVYFTSELTTYVRIAEADILTSAPHQAEQGQLARTVLYVREHGNLEQVIPLKREMQAGFLGGQFVAGLGRAGAPPSQATGATTYVCLSLVTISIITVTTEPHPDPVPTNPGESMASCCLCWTPEAFC